MAVIYLVGRGMQLQEGSDQNVHMSVWERVSLLEILADLHCTVVCHNAVLCDSLRKRSQRCTPSEYVSISWGLVGDSVRTHQE